jgi:hypothetical protein
VRSLRAIWIDGGTKDEWFLDIGAQAFQQALADAGVAGDVVHFELFDAKHGHRLPLPALAGVAQQPAGVAPVARPSLLTFVRRLTYSVCRGRSPAGPYSRRSPHPRNGPDWLRTQPTQSART